MRHHINSGVGADRSEMDPVHVRESFRVYALLGGLGVFAVTPFLLKDNLTSRDCLLICAVGALLLLFVALDSVFGPRAE